MTIEYSTGSIFDCGADVLVCPVNCVGVMGKGLALEFKKRFPYVYRWYKHLCDERLLLIGWPISCEFQEKIFVLFPTKTDWRAPSNINWIDEGLGVMTGIFTENNTIAIPALGCGLGGLDWADVEPLIEKHFADWPGRAIVFPPKEER